MAGQDDLDLRIPCVQPCGDIAAVRSAVDMLGKRQDEHFDQLKTLMKKQDEHYETLRKRLHEVGNDAHRTVNSTAARLDGEIDSVAARVSSLDGKYSILSSDLNLLTHMVTENAKTSEDRHQAVMAGIDYLRSRWWTVAMTLLTGVGGIAGWLILDKLGWL